MSSPTSLVIDCDPGIDDAVALALAVASPEVDLIAATTVSGNAPVAVTSHNALQLLQAFGRQDVPGAAGATRALVRIGWHGLPSPHGDDGLGGVEMTRPRRALQREHAVEHLAALLGAAAPRSVTVPAIGPLTNVALLLAMHPEAAGRIDRLVVMGGSMGSGHITPTAEFNIWTDPEAAQRVLAGSGLPVCLVGLDVTRRATVDESALDGLRRTSPRGRLLAKMIEPYGDRHSGGWPLHDVLAVACVIDPDLVQTAPALVEVDTGRTDERGRLKYTFVEGADGGATRDGAGSMAACDVAVDLDVEQFRSLVLSRAAGRS